jgi:hypothetical protein
MALARDPQEPDPARSVPVQEGMAALFEIARQAAGKANPSQKEATKTILILCALILVVDEVVEVRSGALGFVFQQFSLTVVCIAVAGSLGSPEPATLRITV